MDSRQAIAIACGLFSALLTQAQPHWLVDLPPVHRDGYYTIVLSSEVVGRSREDLSDLRLLDPAGKEVAYFIEREPAVYERTGMRSYKLLRNERVRRTTIIEMEADSLATVDELLVRVRNARANKRARITGSDDRADWYMIQDECLAVGEGEGVTSVLRFVDLPLSDYRYYRIVLDDSLSAPVQVLDLGHTARTRTEGRYTPVPGLTFSRAEDHNASRIALTAGRPFKADRLSFDIRSEVPFLRRGRFSHRVGYTVREHKRDVWRTREEELGTFTLMRSSRSVVDGPGGIVDTLWLVIDNGNDRPLEITGIHAFQLEQRLVAHLKADSIYTLTTADPKAGMPHYDIALLQDSLPAPSGTVQAPDVMSPRDYGVVQAEPGFTPAMKWVWAAIIGIGAVIAFSAVRLLRKSSTTPD